MEAHVWNSLISALPGAHILQTWEWGQVKSAYGWKPTHLVWFTSQSGHLQVAQAKDLPADVNALAAALVLQREVRLGWQVARMLYVPKGPLLADWGDDRLRLQVLNDLQDLACRQGAIFIKIDPDVRVGTGIPEAGNSQESQPGCNLAEEFTELGWRVSPDQVQFRNTVLIELSYPETELLARMKQKTRYNVRLAERKGVRVRQGTLADLELLYQMYAETSLRDGFAIRDQEYYFLVWRTFIQAGLAQPFIAEVEHQPVAALILFYLPRKAWYLYGMSRQIYREWMPNYLLQWEAIRWAKAQGIREYDLWGAPDHFTPQDPLWGVYRFKEGLGGVVVRHIGAWDYVVRPVSYQWFVLLLPRWLAMLRARGKFRTRASLAQV